MSDRTRVAAAIDIGSNSVHLLVMAVDGEQRRVLRDESELLGLGAIVDLEGRIPDATTEAALAIVRRYVAAARDERADWLVLVATEPLRRAANRSHVMEMVRAGSGLPVHALSHEEEALLTVVGVLGGVAPQEPTLVLDIGGGSTEVVLLEPGSDPVVGVLPVGSARLTAAFVEADPPTAQEVAALRAEARRLLAGMPVGHPQRGIVVGGSGTNLVRLATAGGDPSAGGVDDGPVGSADEPWVIDRVRLGEAIRIVLHHPSAELAVATGLRERRVVQMAAGACLIEAALEVYGLSQVEASEASLREGAILAWERAGDAWRERIAELVSGDLGSAEG